MKRLNCVMLLWLISVTVSLGQRQEISLCPTSSGVDFCSKLAIIKKASENEMKRISRMDSLKLTTIQKKMKYGYSLSMPALDSLLRLLNEGVNNENYQIALRLSNKVVKHNYVAKNGHFQDKYLSDVIPELIRIIKAQEFQEKQTFSVSPKRLKSLNVCPYQQDGEQLPTFFCQLVNDLLTNSRQRLQMVRNRTFNQLTEFDRSNQVSLPGSIEPLERLQDLLSDGVQANEVEEVVFLCDHVYQTNPIAQRGLKGKEYLKQVIPALHQAMVNHFDLDNSLPENGIVPTRRLNGRIIVSLCPTSLGIDYCKKLRELKKTSDAEMMRIESKKESNRTTFDKQTYNGYKKGQASLDKLITILDKGVTNTNKTSILSLAAKVRQHNYIARKGAYKDKDLANVIPELQRIINAQAFFSPAKNENPTDTIKELSETIEHHNLQQPYYKSEKSSNRWLIASIALNVLLVILLILLFIKTKRI